MYKVISCPKCDGYGFISHSEDNGIWSAKCDECNSEGNLVVPMTNGDIIRGCNNEELCNVFQNLKTFAIYSGGENNRLLYCEDNPEDLLLWLNKEADAVDMKTIFDFVNEEEHDKPYYFSALAIT